jgi:branched-chain amino acid transport system substrate-binding protein
VGPARRGGPGERAGGAGARTSDRLSAAFRGLKVATPIGPITFRPVDGQSTMGAWVGTTKLDPKRGVGIMVNYEYVPGEKVLPSEDEIRKMRSGGEAVPAR